MLIGVTRVNAQVVLCDALTKTRFPIYQGIEGWFFRSAADLNTDYELVTIQEGIRGLSKALAEKDITLVVLPVPSKGMVYGDKLKAEDIATSGFSVDASRTLYTDFVNNVQAEGVVVVDLLTPFLAAKQTTDIFPKLDGHWTPEGAKLAAQIVAQSVGELERYISLPKMAFETQLVGSKPPPEGAMQVALRDKCNIQLADENMNQYDTLSTSVGLLDETTTPVALAGTSYSGEWRNFSGFLSEALQVDVLNNFVPAGGLFTSLQDLIIKLGDLEQAPTFIIWEFPIHMTRSGGEDFSNFRQLIPSVYDACPVEMSLAHTSTEVNGTTIVVLENKDWKSDDGDKYLVLEATDKTLVNFTVNISHTDGETESLTVDRSTRVPNSGKFFVKLQSGRVVQKVSLVVPASITGVIDVRVCSFP